MNKAFTLIELAIAIIIIGLLAATISVGGKMIENAKIQRLGSELQEVETAFITFRSIYNSLPGDMQDAFAYFEAQDCGFAAEDSNGGTQAERCNGDGDGNIVGSGTGALELCREEHKFWNHLYHAELVTSIIPSCSATLTSKKYNLATISPFYYDATTNLDLGRVNVLRVGRQRSDLITANEYATYQNEGKLLNPQKAKSIDIKYDDGVAYSGRIQAFNGYDASSNQDGNCSSDTVNAANDTDYQLAEELAECFLLYRLEDI